MSERCMDTYTTLGRRIEGRRYEEIAKFVCLRPKGHLGWHVCRGFGGRILKKWANR